MLGGVSLVRHLEVSLHAHTLLLGEDWLERNPPQSAASLTPGTSESTNKAPEPEAHRGTHIASRNEKAQRPERPWGRKIDKQEAT